MRENKSFILAIVFTFISLLLALGPGMWSLIFYGQFTAYRSQTSILTATLIAIIWYTAFTYDNLFHNRKINERKTKSLATALLSELRWLYDILHDFATAGNLSGNIPTPILESAVKNLTLFRSETVDRLVYVYRGLEKFRETRRRQEQRGLGGETDTLRMFATFICIGIANLTPQLENEGGIHPILMPNEDFEQRDIPRIIPDDPFPRERREDLLDD